MVKSCKKVEGTHLVICKADCGEYGDDIQIVTGAPNVYEGMHTPAALDGATLPGTYLNCTGFDNVADWALTVGGEDTKRYRIGYSDGVIQIRPVGTAILLR